MIKLIQEYKKLMNDYEKVTCDYGNIHMGMEDMNDLIDRAYAINLLANEYAEEECLTKNKEDKEDEDLVGLVELVGLIDVHTKTIVRSYDLMSSDLMPTDARSRNDGHDGKVRTLEIKAC